MKFILTIVLIYYSLKMIGRYVFPYLIKRFMGKMETRMNQQQGFEKEEDITIGETVIDTKPKDKTSNKDVGEYVDYEEVD